jgi:hypothetical protein
MMHIPLLDLKAQYATIRSEVREAMDRVCESQHFILGPEVTALKLVGDLWGWLLLASPVRMRSWRH